MKNSIMSLVLLATVNSGAQAADPVTSCETAALKSAVGIDRIGSVIWEDQFSSSDVVSLAIPESYTSELLSSEVLNSEAGTRATREVYVVSNENASGNVISTQIVEILNQTKKVHGQDDKAFCKIEKVTVK